MRQPHKALLNWDDKGIGVLIQPRSRSTGEVNTVGWLTGLSVTADGTGIAMVEQNPLQVYATCRGISTLIVRNPTQ